VNLLVVTIDSLRFDYVSRTNPQIRTPNFDRVAQGLLDFIPTCFSVSSATRPVHTSLFSGLYPFEHGIESQRDGTIRTGTPRLLRLMEQQQYATGAFSEAPEIFAGLDLGVPVQRLETIPQRGLGQLFEWLNECRGQPCSLFVHYWSTHAPYGAADGMAMGETAQLLHRGQLETVQQRYRAAVIELFEQKLTPVLQRLDPFEWTVVVLGDHGESWTPDELYHGQTLRNAVLRVPLYMHLPRTQQLPSPPIASVVDLFPTLANLFGLPADYRGFARDLSVAVARKPHYCLAEIKPIDPGAGDDVTPTHMEGGWSAPQRRIWALFDEKRKFTFHQHSETGELQETFSELPLTGASNAFVAAYQEMRESSEYAHLPLESAAPGASALIDDRLRALGYLS
jgi:arylsulfatase A-like enzyme